MRGSSAQWYRQVYGLGRRRIMLFPNLQKGLVIPYGHAQCARVSHKRRVSCKPNPPLRLPSSSSPWNSTSGRLIWLTELMGERAS